MKSQAKTPSTDTPESMNSSPNLLITVDGPSTRDIDDAFSLASTEAGWQLKVAIATPAAIVTPGSELDMAARKLAATVYGGTRVIKSMLPLALSENQCSLVAGADRLAMVISIDLDARLQVLATQVSFDQVTVSNRLTYEDVPRLAGQQDTLGQLLRDAINVSKGLLAGRRSSGALAFFDLKTLIYLDEDGAMQHAKSVDDMVGHIVIQEFMVLANTQLARWAIEKELPFIYRSHRPKLAAPPVADILESMQTMNEEALKAQLAVIMGTAVYSPHALGHYALSLPYYAHTTSPLRRYVDLVNQRQIRAHCAGMPPAHGQDEITAICSEINEVLAQAKIDRSDSFKAAVVNRAARALDGGHLSRLGDPELVQAIKLAASSGGMPATLGAYLANRMRAEGLADKVLDVMVTAASAIELPEVLIEAWCALLLNEPTRAKHFLMFAIQTDLAGQHSTRDRAIDTSGFEVHVSILRKSDGTTLSASALAPRKKDAENLASARLICQFMGAPASSTQARDVLSTSTPPAAPAGALQASDRRNFKGEIMEFCQKRRIAPPAFEVSSTGPSNDARFTCRATLQHPGGLKSVVFEGAKTKKDAEAGASRKLLDEVGL